MRQFVSINDYFGDMVVDKRFFDPSVEGPESIGSDQASLEGGGAPLRDTSDEPSFVRTAQR
jgi:hypothetical protein